eukprot:symbB.v1.2.033120.t1/scaffold4071.1/size45255/7
MSTDSLTLWTTVVVTITLSLAAKRLARAAWAPENSLQKTTPPSSTVATCCPICLEGINEAEECRLPCGHLFHETCLKRWFQVSSVCPYRCDEPDSDVDTDRADASCFALSAERCRAARAAYRRAYVQMLKDLGDDTHRRKLGDLTRKMSTRSARLHVGPAATPSTFQRRGKCAKPGQRLSTATSAWTIRRTVPKLRWQKRGDELIMVEQLKRTLMEDLATHRRSGAWHYLLQELLLTQDAIEGKYAGQIQPPSPFPMQPGLLAHTAPEASWTSPPRNMPLLAGLGEDEMNLQDLSDDESTSRRVRSEEVEGPESLVGCILTEALRSGVGDADAAAAILEAAARPIPPKKSRPRATTISSSPLRGVAQPRMIHNEVEERCAQLERDMARVRARRA